MNSIPAKIINRRLFYNEASFQRFAEKHEGKTIDLVPRVIKRTLTQNAFYHVYLDIIAEETGNDHDDLHEYFKAKLLPMKTVTIKGKSGAFHEFKRLQSTTDLSKADFGDYLDRICALTNVPLPDPQEAGYLPR